MLTCLCEFKFIVGICLPNTRAKCDNTSMKKYKKTDFGITTTEFSWVFRYFHQYPTPFTTTHTHTDTYTHVRAIYACIHTHTRAHTNTSHYFSGSAIKTCILSCQHAEEITIKDKIHTYTNTLIYLPTPQKISSTLQERSCTRWRQNPYNSIS